MERIKMEDFLKEYVEALEIETDALTPEKRVNHRCPKCSRNFDEHTNFCPEDGAEIAKEEYEVRSEGFDRLVKDAIYGIGEEGEENENFNYEIHDTLSKKHEDASGQSSIYVFKRKSDGKFFYYSMYEGRVEEYSLEECTKKEIVVWDFESTFA